MTNPMTTHSFVMLVENRKHPMNTDVLTLTIKENAVVTGRGIKLKGVLSTTRGSSNETGLDNRQ